MELELELELEELMYKMLMCMGRELMGMEEGEEELMDKGMERMDMQYAESFPVEVGRI